MSAFFQCRIFTSLEYCFLIQIKINSRIVVVGASDTGQAFLESLIYSDTLNFTQLKLVSKNGLVEKQNDDSLLDGKCYSERSYLRLTQL